MKNVLLATLVALTSLASVPAHSQDLWKEVQARGSLRCGTALAPPHIMRDPATGTYSGLFVDICKDFADVLGVKAEYVDTTWDSIVAGVQNNRWDMALALNRTPKRALALAFSDSVWDTKTTFAFRKADTKIDASWKTPQDFDKPGIIFAVTLGSAQDKLMTDLVKSAEILRLPDIDAIRLAVLSGRATIVADDVDSNSIFAAGQNGNVSVSEPEPALGKQGQAIGLPRDISAADVQALNILIEQQKNSGEIERRMKKYVAAVAAQAK